MSETRGGTCVTSDDQSSRQQLRPNVYDNIQPKPSPVLCEPLHPRFAELMDRITSFDDPQWPIRCPVKPNDLAAAGFYYYGNFEGVTDSVKCFYCDTGLCLWEKGDDAWTEHKRVAPNCPFVVEHHPDIVKKTQADEVRRKEEAARDPNEVVDDWMKGIMIAQFLEKNKVSRTQMRNILHQRWMQQRTPFENMGQLHDAVEIANQKLDDKSNHNRFSIQSMLRKLPISGRSKKNSTGSDDEVSDSSQQSSYCSLSSSQSSSQSSQSSDEDDRSSRLLCKVCLDQRLEVVFIPCGHFICCTTCSRSLSHCPYCRKHIASALKTYLS